MTKSPKDVPEKFRKLAHCVLKAEGDSQKLAEPDRIRLFGNVRKESMNSALGQIELRWPRDIESLFGKTPVLAVADAFRTASRALKHASFPTPTRSLDISWNIVFLDENLPSNQIPTYLVSNCHPAWMTPPSNIYVVAQRVAVGCDTSKEVKKKVADAELIRVMLHEIGHAIEYQLPNKRLPLERFRSEGFASWFEAYAANFTSKIKSGSVKDSQLRVARHVHSKITNAFVFRGTGSDYSYAASYFHFVVAKRNVAGLVDVYDLIGDRKLSFLAAVDQEFAWNMKRRSQLFSRFLEQFG